jgi:hypothetical protein
MTAVEWLEKRIFREYHFLLQKLLEIYKIEKGL